MARSSIITIAILATLWVLGSPASSTLGAENSAWIVRPIALGLSVENLDVMVGPGDEVIVGYAAPAQTGPGGDVALARLPAGEMFFQRRTELGGGNAASFAADRFGNVFYGSRDPLSGLRAGQDFGGFSIMLSSLHPASSNTVASAVPTLGVNPGGLPVLADMNKSGVRFISTFNPIEGRWQSDTLAGLGLDSPVMPAGPNSQALTFDTAGKPALVYVQRTGSVIEPLIVARRGDFGWTNVANDTAMAAYGTGVAAAPDGAIGFAYVDGSGRLSFNSDNDGLGTRETISAQFGYLTPHSLAYDANGNPAVVYSQAATAAPFTPLHLARRNALGQWTDEILPVNSRLASLSFDTQGGPLVAAYTSTGITLLGKNILGLNRGDFNLDGTSGSQDVGGFVQALRRQTTYLAAHQNMATPDLLPLGDYSGNNSLDDRDARQFADSLSATPLPGLPNRKTGYVALDQADADLALGSGKGNLFNTALATKKPYQAGDSRGDLTGATPGEPDRTINAKDIDYLFAHLNGSDTRADLNGDGLVNKSDADVLVKEILGTFYGDADLNGAVGISDLSLLLTNFGKPGAWSTGDFDGNKVVGISDLSLLLTNFGKTAGIGVNVSSCGGLDVQAIQMLSNAGFTVVPEPSNIILLTTLAAATGLWGIGRLRRNRGV